MLDANGTRYHLLLGSRDWEPATDGDPALAWDNASHSLALRSTLPPLRPRAERDLEEEMRRGADRDRFATVYWIDGERSAIRVRPESATEAGTYWEVERLFGGVGVEPPRNPECDFRPCPDPTPAPQPPTLWGLAVTRSHRLVVGTRGPSGLLLFDLAGGGPPVWWRWPEALDFSPLDMKATEDGELWILDRPADTPARLWRLDHNLRLVGDFTPAFSSPPADPPDFADEEPPTEPAAECLDDPVYPEPVALLDGLSPSEALENPISVEVLPDGSVLILDNPPGLPFSLIHRFVEGTHAASYSLSEVLPVAESEGGVADLRAQDFVFLAADSPGVAGGLYVASQREGQAFLFAAELESDVLFLEICPRYLPMRRFSGKALIAADCDVLYDFDERWLVLAEHPRRRYESEAVTGAFVFDGKQPKVQWHRLLLDGCIPNGSSVRVESRTAETRSRLTSERWRREPPPLLRASGSELPFDQPFADCDEERDDVGTWDLLFQQARGRYLELRFLLQGDGRSSPRLRAARIYYPRFSYLEQYLPAIYGDEPDSASLLDRFLANPEGIYTALEGRIANAQALLDSRTAPPEYLDWLAGWLGAVLDENWEEERRRLFLAHAHELYLWRGTPSGLLTWLRLALEPCPSEELFAQLGDGDTCSSAASGLRPFDYRLVETFLARGVPPAAVGDSGTAVGPTYVATDSPWLPEHGSAALEERFRDFARQLYPDLGAPDLGVSDLGVTEEAESEPPEGSLNRAWGAAYASWSEVLFPPLEPQSETWATDRRAFLDSETNVLYAEVSEADRTSYQEFLARRYRQVSLLNQTHQLGGALAWTSFDSVELPSRLPSTQAALLDWIDFVSVHLPIREGAHRFSVLVPTEPGESLEERQLKLDRAALVVEREKPAHTEFEVKPFWALFQVGSARLGFETLVGDGSRFVGLVLGRGALGETYLTESFPWTETDRWIVGRDAPTERLPGRDCPMEN